VWCNQRDQTNIDLIIKCWEMKVCECDEMTRDQFHQYLWAAFANADPKSAKKHWWLDFLFALLWSACIKASCKTLVKLIKN